VPVFFLSPYFFMRISASWSLRTLAITLLLVLCLPLQSSAAVFAGNSGSGVSRGDFIRAAVQALKLDTSAADLSALSRYVRVAKGLQPYIAVAHEKGALTLFGKDLTLAQGITRGEAVQVVVKLGAFDPVTPSSHFQDVRKGTSVEGAVGVAEKKEWLQPLRDSVFGANRLLVPSDAQNFIRMLGKTAVKVPPKKEGKDVEDTVQTIRINVEKSPQQSIAFPKGEILSTLWQLIQKNYLYQDKVDADDVAYGAAEAIMKSLNDPYSVFMRPVNSRNFQTQIQGEVTGIGAQVEYKNEILTIVTPLRGSPAEAAGLKPGDQILAVDGVSIVKVGFGEAVERVRGPKGSSVEITIRRDGIEFKTKVRRDTITVPEIEISWQQEFAIVKLLQFGSLTDTQLRSEMKKVQQQNPKGIVLDLRNNPGGLLHAADVVVSNFVKNGSAVAVVAARNEERTEYTTQDPTIDFSVPVVVLVNGGSASASEIVAGALQDLKRATVLGEQTFGKGTVQQVLQFNDQSAMKMTIAEWLTPLRRKIDGIGLKPDIVVVTDERDTQMSEALNLLRKQGRR
jgi:carboxyl-terminal processing protease